MNWYKIFYWLTVADNFKSFFTVMIILTTIGVVVAVITWLSGRDAHTLKITDTGRNGRKMFYYFFSFATLFWLFYLFTPSKSDTLLIIAGGSVGNFITSDSSSKAIPADITRFLHTKLQAEIADANDEVKKQLNMQTPKERLIEKAKELTKEELIQYLQEDTTVLKR